MKRRLANLDNQLFSSMNVELWGILDVNFAMNISAEYESNSLFLESKLHNNILMMMMKISNLFGF